MPTPYGCLQRRITHHVSSRQLMALRGGRPGKRACLSCGKAAQHCQFWLPPGLLQAVPDVTEKPSVYWLCDAHYGQLSEAAIVALLVRRGRGRKGVR